MNKADLIDLLASAHALSKAEAGRILETLLSTIVKTVKKGGSVGIAGFGAFKMQARSARGGYNPATRSKMKIPAVKVPKFSPGTAFRAEVDPRAAARKAAARAGAAAEGSVAAGGAGVLRGAPQAAAKVSAKAPVKAASRPPATTVGKTAAKAASKTAVKAAAKAPSAKGATKVGAGRA